MLVWALAACYEIHLDPIENVDAPTFVVVEDSFVQAPHAAIDVLWVVDDTPSMNVEIEALVDAAATFTEALGVLRWQVGVTTTAMDGERAGWLLGSPWIITPSSDAPAAALERALDVDAEGAGPEAGFAAALAALGATAPGSVNAGFRRDDASLHVVFVSDADDHSDAWLGADPVGAFLAELATYEHPERPARVSAITGGSAGCSGISGQAVAAPRYLAAVAATGGSAASICASGYASVVENLATEAVDWPTRFPLTSIPASTDMEVRVDRERVFAFTVASGEGWAEIVFDTAPPPGASIEVSYLVRVDA